MQCPSFILAAGKSKVKEHKGKAKTRVVTGVNITPGKSRTQSEGPGGDSVQDTRFVRNKLEGWNVEWS